MKKLLSIMLTILMLVTSVPYALAADDGIPLTVDVTDKFNVEIGSGYEYYDEDGYIITGTNQDASVRIYEPADLTFRDATFAGFITQYAPENSVVNITLEGTTEVTGYVSIADEHLIFDGDEAAIFKAPYFATGGYSGSVTVNGGNIDLVTEGGYTTINCVGGFIINGGTVTAYNNSTFVVGYEVTLNGGELNINSTSADTAAVQGPITMKNGTLLTFNAESGMLRYDSYAGYIGKIVMADGADETDCFFVRYDKGSDFVPVFDINSALDGKSYAEIKIDTHEHSLNNIGKCICGYECTHESITDNKCDDCGAEVVIVTIEMTDSFGDGWSGNAIVIKQFVDGVYTDTEAGTATIEYGESGTFTTVLPKDGIFALSWLTGEYPGDCSFTIAVDGETVYECADGSTLTDGQMLYVTCEHTSYTDGKCDVCGYECTHESYTDSKCDACGYICTHEGQNGSCQVCGENLGELVIDVTDEQYVYIGSGEEYYDEDGYIITGTNQNAYVWLYESADLTLRDATFACLYTQYAPENSVVNITLEGTTEVTGYVSIADEHLIFDGDEAAIFKAPYFTTGGRPGSVTVNGGNIVLDYVTESYSHTIACNGGFIINGGTVTASNNFSHVVHNAVTLNGGELNVISTSADYAAIEETVTMKKGALLTVSAASGMLGYDSDAGYIGKIVMADGAEENDYFFVRYDTESEFVPVQDIESALDGKAYAEIKIDTHEHSYTDGICDCGYVCLHVNFADGICPDCTASGKLVAIKMSDSNNNGWYGKNAVVIKQLVDGAFEEVETATLTDGKSGTVAVNLDKDGTYVITWQSDYYPNECGFEIYVDGECVYSISDARGIENNAILYTICEHTGGKADCLHRAVCEKCGNEYGEVDADGHIMEDNWSWHSSEQHMRGCTICHTSASYEYEDHYGGSATCSTLAICEGCGQSYGELGAHTAEPTYVPNAGDSTQHDATYSCCGATVTEAHTMNVTTGKCVCGADMTAIATVTDGTNTYYAADAATLNQAVTAILETGSRTFTVELPADAEAGMITAIRRAICDTEGVADGSINLTLKGVTTIPGTTNWDGVAFGLGDIYDEAGEIVDQELVTQLASINLPDATEIGAQAFYFCENLVAVSAPKAQTIGAQALGYTALTSVEFPELTTIPTDMFSGTWTLSSAKFPKVTTIEQGGLLVGAKFMPENNPTPFPLELTAEGDITFNGSNHFNIKSQNYSGKVDLVLNIDKKDQVTFNDDGTATWQVRDDLSYTFKSITFTCTDGTTNHSYTYTDNGDGTHDATCTACGAVVDNDAHAIENHVCTACGAMEIVVSFDAGDYEWKTGDTLYFCRVSGDNEWEEYAFTATVAGDGTVTWTPDRTLYWDGTGEHKLVVIYPDTGYVLDTWYVDEDQATPETLRKNDRLDAIWSGNPTTDTITFNLKHRMAKVTVNYEAAEGVTISKAEVYTLTQYVFFDEDTLERINIAWEEGHDLWINSYLNDGQFTAFVSPDAYAAGGNFIKITLSDGSVREVKMNKAVTFAEGAEYTYKVVITADGAALKADYTYIDEVIKKIEEKFADENLTDEAKAGLEEIKAELEEMKADGNTSAADLAELEKALEDYETELDAGIEDGSAVKVNGLEEIVKINDALNNELAEKYGEEALAEIAEKVDEKFADKFDELYERAEALTGSVAENKDALAEIEAEMEAIFAEVENCLNGTHNGLKFEITEEAKCGENAIESATCTLCGEVLTKEVENSALTHSFTKYEETEAPKCGVAGKEVAYCDNGCGATDEKEIPALVHEPRTAVVENEVAAECEKAGSYDLVVYCELCGEELDRDTTTVDALTHSFTKYEVTEEAECGKAGKEVATCDHGCGATDEKEIPALTHKDADGDYKCDYGCGHEFEKPAEPEDPSANCDHLCHSNNWFVKNIIWKIVKFFWKLFKMNPVCECGAAHY